MKIPVRDEAQSFIDGIEDKRTGRQVEHEVKMAYLLGLERGQREMMEVYK